MAGASKKVGELFFDIRAGIQSLQKDLNEGKKAIATFEKNATKVFSTFKNTLLVGAAIAAPALAIKKFGDAIGHLAAKGAALDDMEQNFRRLGGTASSLNAARDAVLGAVSSLDLMRVANEGLIRNIPQFNEKFGQLAEFAQRFGDATGQNVTQVLNNLTDALAKGKTKGLEPFGFALDKSASKAQIVESVYAQLQDRINTFEPALVDVDNSLQALNNSWEMALSRMGQGVNANEELAKKFRELQKAVDDTDWTQFGNDLATIYSVILDIATKALPQAIDLVNDFANALEYLTGSTSRAKVAAMNEELGSLSEELASLDKKREGGRGAHAIYDSIFGSRDERKKQLQEDIANLTKKRDAGIQVLKEEKVKKVEIEKKATEEAATYRAKINQNFNTADIANNKKSAEKKQKDSENAMDKAVDEFYKLNVEFYKDLEKLRQEDAQKLTEEYANAFDEISVGLSQIFDQLGSEGFGNLANSLGRLLEDTTKESILSGLADALGVSAGELKGLGNAVINIASDIINASESDKANRDNRGTGQAVGGAGGAAVGAYFGNPELGQQIGAAVGSELGKLFGRGSQDADEMARSSFARYIEAEIFKLKTVAFYNQGGQLQTQKAENFNFIQGDSNRFNDGSWAEDFKKNGAEAQNVFKGLGHALKETLGITEEVGDQFAYLLGEQLGGNIDNARLMVQQLGLDFGTLEEALVQAAKKGTISWQEFSIDMAGLTEAFKPGLVAVGDLSGAWDGFINSAGRGQAALKAAKDIGVEAVEKGAQSFDQARQILIQAGKNPEEVNAYFDALLARGLTTFEQLAAAEDATLGAAIGDAGNNSEMLSDTWKKATAELENYASALDALPEVKVINLQWKSEIDGNTQDIINSGIAGESGLNIPTTTASDNLEVGMTATAARTARSMKSRRSSGGGNFNINIDASGDGDAEVKVRRAVNSMKDTIVKQTTKIVRDNHRRNAYDD